MLTPLKSKSMHFGVVLKENSRALVAQWSLIYAKGPYRQDINVKKKVKYRVTVMVLLAGPGFGQEGCPPSRSVS